MCGIAGLIQVEGELERDADVVVKQMNQALRHRGPDAAGYFCDDCCALAMRRLSIIDLEKGQQPIYNESKDILVFMNGEIYNYRFLRSQLEDKQHFFSTNTDTEVLVHLYEEYGESMFSHLEGMFAFCIYDKRNQSFVIGRDRFGEKPLYYHNRGGVFSFSSEINSLLENAAIERKLDREALGYYLRTSLVPDPMTMFEGIKSLLPGHFIRIVSGTLSIHKYFSVDYNVNHDIRSLQDAVDHVKPHLLNAVRNQSVSDVPIGAFLSGGIDSSTMVALLQQQSDKPIKTFNVRFENQAYDESYIARVVAKHCGTDHQEIFIPKEEFREEIFWEIIEHVGQPFRDSSAIPTYHVSKAIKKHVKVAISGDGGDELFGGYDLFQWYTKICKLKAIPKPFRHMAHRIIRSLQVKDSFNGNNKLRQLDRVIGTTFLEEKDIAIALNEMFKESEIISLLTDGDIGGSDDAAAFSKLKVYPEQASDWSQLRKIMYYRTCHTLPNNMLVKVDRMSMANSLEVRAPFLDFSLFKASAELPDEFLIRNGIGKYVIREAMKDELPDEVFNHPKQGFNLPLFDYRNDAFKGLAERLFFENNPFKGLFKETELRRIFDQGLGISRDDSGISVFRATHQLWMVMQLLGWAEKYKVNY